MTKTALIDALASKLGVTKKLAGDFLNAFVALVEKELKKGGDVRIQGFGTFKVTHRAARMGVNPQNPSQKIKISASKSPSFKAGKAFKDALN
ncbi:MAG: HU family DNA-binding protein [Candidatus Peribacteria bacterium]|nr:MAG: HU family DNA-binding protein [Candidatus Peribacteria bacterium]